MDNDSDLQIKKALYLAQSAAQDAGKRLGGIFVRFDRKSVKLKEHAQLLTQADLASEDIIIAAIRKNFPEHAILAEESGRSQDQSDWLWIVDPIDGTTNFSFHNPLWSISIGVAHKGELVAGVIHAPMLGETYTVAKGQGAFLNGERIQVSDLGAERAIHTFCHGSSRRDVFLALDYARTQKMRRIDCRQLGSAAIELAYVASGRIESILIPGTRPWDVAAGALLVCEAGGMVTDFRGKKWGIEDKDMLATNGKVHEEVLETVRQLTDNS
ncbi:MAG TPA: inositol monophosphatase family protein [Candidatus Moranbacteria bacterium]|nr:inositol monophosphatase family protein [Candidatus Moranbacteria bacterium]